MSQSFLRFNGRSRKYIHGSTCQCIIYSPESLPEGIFFKWERIRTLPLLKYVLISKSFSRNFGEKKQQRITVYYIYTYHTCPKIGQNPFFYLLICLEYCWIGCKQYRTWEPSVWSGSAQACLSQYLGLLKYKYNVNVCWSKLSKKLVTTHPYSTI